jgi:predicted nucleic acid-binding Zn ribbon protein
MAKPGRPERRGQGPSALGELVPKVLEELGLDETSLAVRLLEVWDEALGAPTAAHCRLEGIRHGALVAVVPDSAWMQRLQLEKPAILARLRERLGDEVPAEMRFRVGRVE